MTRHVEEDAYVVDTILRNFPPVEPFVVRRAHPLMVRDGSLNPKALKKAGGTQEKYSDKDILASLEGVGMTTTEWQQDVIDRIGISPSGFHDRRRKLEKKGLIRKEKTKWIKVSK
jgi:DNA-binding MarR family transcriptional regulator